MFELKSLKLKDATSNKLLPFSSIKKIDWDKCNEYSRCALASFVHFLLMYAPSKDSNISGTVFRISGTDGSSLTLEEKNTFEMSVDELTTALQTEPDDSACSIHYTSFVSFFPSCSKDRCT